MGDDEKKLNEELDAYEQEQAAAGKVKVDSADGSGSMWLTPDQAATYQAKQKAPASKTPELNLEEKYKAAEERLETSNTKAVNAISNSYGTQENTMSKILEEAETLRGEQQKLDETAQKRQAAYRYISGIGDAISGVANLVGTAHGAANQEQHYNAPAVIQKAEASRKERKLEMDKLNERIRELKAQKGALAASKEMKLGEQRAKHAAAMAELELQKAKDELGLAKAKIDAESRENAAITRGEYQVKTQEEKNKKTTDSGPRQPQTQHQFDFGNGEGAVIPKHKWTKATMAEVYSLIPEEERTKRVRKNQYGIDEKDAEGNPVYYTPSEDEMTADIVAAAKKYPEVQGKLKALEEGRIFDTL